MSEGYLASKIERSTNKSGKDNALRFVRTHDLKLKLSVQSYKDENSS